MEKMKAGFKKPRSKESVGLMKAAGFPIPKTVDSESADRPTRRKNRLDALTESLGASGYFHKMRWDWFTYTYGGLAHPLSVDRFYHERKLAIDVMSAKLNIAMMDHKRKLLGEHGIEYVILDSEYDMDGLMKAINKELPS